MFDNADMIFSYSRAQAIEDGVLFEVPQKLSREAGISIPVALSEAVFNDTVAWDDATTKATGCPQDLTGRLWDVLWMLRLAARNADSSTVMFEVLRVPRSTTNGEPRAVRLKAVIDGGDDGSPVITVMFPHED